jgi:hypothetical protein
MKMSWFILAIDNLLLPFAPFIVVKPVVFHSANHIGYMSGCTHNSGIFFG